MQRLHINDKDFEVRFNRIVADRRESDPDIFGEVSTILNEVQVRGDEAVAEDAAEIVDLRGDQPVVLGQQAGRRVLQVALRDGDELRRSLDLSVHDDRQRRLVPKSS